MSGLPHTGTSVGASLHYLVLGPDSSGVSPADVRRLFRGQRLTAMRRNRVTHGARIVVLCGSRMVGLAAFDRIDGEIRVYELGLDPSSSCATDEIANSLLDALELACMASGVRRLSILSRAALSPALTRHRGYVTVGEGSPTSVVQKSFV